MSDALMLLQLIDALVERVRRTTALVRAMKAEGRDKLTPEELASLQADDDDARGELVDAIERAKAEGR
jgi:hypothetical protein